MSATEGFARSQRLLTPAEFEAVFAHRCAVRARFFQVLGRPNTLGHARLGMVVSKRLLPRAVDRNRVRRLIRELFRHAALELPALDLVIRPHSKPPAEWPLDDLHAAIAGAVKKCGV